MSGGDRPKVLMIAFACNPEGSGEHWLGWGWAEQASKSFRVHLITSANAREQVMRQAAAHGIEPHFIATPFWLRMVTAPFGRFGAWVRKEIWQVKAARMARKLHRCEKFSLVHQTTFHTFRVPFLAAGMGIPSVWGPIAGGEFIPYGFYRFIGPLLLPESIRRIANYFWLKLPSVQQSLRNASVLFVSNHTTLEFLPAFCREKAIIVPPNATRPEDAVAPLRVERAPGSRFEILYVGNCLETRAVPLVFHALALAGMPDYRFRVIGSGSGLKLWEKQARVIGVADQVEFVGQVPLKELQRYYDEADVLVFPALRDSGGSSLLEAMSKGVPVICLDWGGPAEMVDERSGIKVSVTTPHRTIHDFAAALLRLREYPSYREGLGACATQRARTMFTWEVKRRLLEETYHRLIGKK